MNKRTCQAASQSVSAIVLFVILLLLIIIPVTHIYAASDKINNGTIIKRVVSLCPSSVDGKHHFKGAGSGSIYKGKYPDFSNCVVKWGTACQCKYCNTILVSQYNPYTSTALGKYAMSSYPHSKSGFICIWVKVVSTNARINNDAITRAMVFE